MTPQRLHEHVTELLGELPAPGESMFERGLDSIRLMTFVGRCRSEGVETSFEWLAENPTLAAWERHLLGGTDTVEGDG